MREKANERSLKLARLSLLICPVQGWAYDQTTLKIVVG